MHHPTRLLTLGFAIVILLMIALAYMGFQSINGNGPGGNQQVVEQLQKINLINELSTIVQNRTRFMQTMLLRDKEFIESESWPNFSRMSGAYAATRERLEPILAPREREIMRTIDELDRDIGDLNRQVSVLFLNGSRDEASKVLLSEVLPKTAPLLANLSELTQMQRLDFDKAMLLSSQDAELSRNRITLFSICAVLISLGRYFYRDLVWTQAVETTAGYEQLPGEKSLRAHRIAARYAKRIARRSQRTDAHGADR